MGRPLKNVLVVEDHPELRRALRSTLEGMGVATAEAGNARAAIERLAAQKPDLVCLDLILPESSGYEVCEYIRQNEALRNVPVLAMSERALPEDRAFAHEAGATAFLPKPFTHREFRAQVLALLDAHQGGRD